MLTLPPRDPRDLGPEGKFRQSSVGLPLWLWAKLDEIAEVDKYTRSELIVLVLKTFADDWDAARAASPPTRKAR